jgi:hypothetical protein
MDTASEVPSSIPGDTKYSEKQLFWNAVHSASIIEDYLKEKVAAPI